MTCGTMSTPPAQTASKNSVANSGNDVQMLPPATTTAPLRRKKNASCRIRSKSGCSPVRNTMSSPAQSAVSKGPCQSS